MSRCVSKASFFVAYVFVDTLVILCCLVDLRRHWAFPCAPVGWLIKLPTICKVWRRLWQWPALRRMSLAYVRPGMARIFLTLEIVGRLLQQNAANIVTNVPLPVVMSIKPRSISTLGTKVKTGSPR